MPRPSNVIARNRAGCQVCLAPADLPKESGRFDLPIAIGILAATGQFVTL